MSALSITIAIIVFLLLGTVFTILFQNSEKNYEYSKSVISSFEEEFEGLNISDISEIKNLRARVMNYYSENTTYNNEIIRRYETLISDLDNLIAELEEELAE